MLCPASEVELQTYLIFRNSILQTLAPRFPLPVPLYKVEHLRQGETAEACIVEPVARIADAPERCPDAPIAITPTTTS